MSRREDVPNTCRIFCFQNVECSVFTSWYMYIGACVLKLVKYNIVTLNEGLWA